MTHAFLSDEWFDEHDRLMQGVEMPGALSKVVANLRIKRSDTSVFEARIDGGFIRKGFSDAASATIAAYEETIYKALVLGDVKSAMPAVFSGKLKIDGDKATLVKLALAPPTESQQSFTGRLKQMTAP